MKKIIYAFKRLWGENEKLMNQKWKYDSKSVILTTPIITQKTDKNEVEILFGTKEGKVFSLDENAKVKWIFDTKENVSNVELMFLDDDEANSIKSTPNVDDINNDGEKEIVFGSESGKLYCLNTKGELMWSYDAKSAIRGSPLIMDLTGDKFKQIVIGTLGGTIHIISSKGEEITFFDVGEGIENRPLLVQNKLVFGTNEGNIKAYNFKGEMFWSYKTKDKISADVEVNDLENNGKLSLIVGSLDGTLYNLSLDGELIWSFDTNGAIMSKVNITDINKDHKLEILFGSCDNNIYCLNNKGEKIWSYETDFWVVSTPIVADIDNDGHLEIIAGSYDHNLYILDSEGSYMLNYIPGVSGIVTQTNNYANITNKETGSFVGRKLWQFKTDDMIVGCATINDKDELVVNTKSGKISNFKFNKGEHNE